MGVWVPSEPYKAVWVCGVQVNGQGHYVTELNAPFPNCCVINVNFLSPNLPPQDVQRNDILPQQLQDHQQSVHCELRAGNPVQYTNAQLGGHNQ